MTATEEELEWLAEEGRKAVDAADRRETLTRLLAAQETADPPPEPSLKPAMAIGEPERSRASS